MNFHKRTKFLNIIAILLIIFAILEFFTIAVGMQHLRRYDMLDSMLALKKKILFVFKSNELLTRTFIQDMLLSSFNSLTVRDANRKFYSLMDRCRYFDSDIHNIRYYAVLPYEKIKYFDEITNKPLSLFRVLASDTPPPNSDRDRFLAPTDQMIQEYGRGKEYIYDIIDNRIFFQFPVHDDSADLLGYIELEYNIRKRNLPCVNFYFLQYFVVTYLALGFYIISYFYVVRHSTAYIESIKESEHLARKRTHDFRNHIQTIYALLSNDDVNETKNYIETLVWDITSIQKLDYLKHPFALFLYTKVAAANANQIEVIMDFDCSIFSSIHIPATHLVDIIGNLLDNAIDAVRELSKADRVIEIQIRKNKDNIVFVISNNGTVEDYQEKIFVTGFTTKENGKGLGLPIVRETVAMLKGKLELTSYSPVIFEVTLPNKKSS
jgi:hypothetical protein